MLFIVILRSCSSAIPNGMPLLPSALASNEGNGSYGEKIFSDEGVSIRSLTVPPSVPRQRKSECVAEGGKGGE